MKRQNPLITSFGILSTAVILILLGLGIWRSGGMAFSPGQLSAKTRPAITLDGYESHLAFQENCARCHRPLETTQGQLCLQCHSNISAQIDELKGAHSKIENVDRCAECHLDHRGKDFDPTESAYQRFDHSSTSFSLVWHQVNYDALPMTCSECHQIEPNFVASNENCALCHGIENLEFMLEHDQNYSSNCLGCHNGHDRMVDFDHQASKFPLEGRHTEVSCSDCHSAEKRLPESGPQLVAYESLFQGTPTDCQACHAEPEAHLGMFSPNCMNCHNSTSWSPAVLDGELFEHTAYTGFSLIKHARDYSDNAIICLDCHQGSLERFEEQSCIDCHSQGDDRANFMQEHRQTFGDSCESCHDGVDRMEGFDHNLVFPLADRHAKADCSACHVDKTFAGTPELCVECHAEPEIHAGFFGLKCEYCHTAKAWAPARLQQHLFPLDHGNEKESECIACHVNDRYAQYTCFECHEHQPEEINVSHTEAGITTDELPQCAQCHPSGKEDEGSNRE